MKYINMYSLYIENEVQKVTKYKGFNNMVVQLVIAIKAIYLEAKNTTSLGAPIALFNAIKLDQALREDAPGQIKAIFNEFLSLKRMHTYTIIRGTVLKGRLLLLSKLVLKYKYNTKGEVIRKKARLYIQGDKQTPNIDYFKIFALVV